jgi:hypothetical protein
MFTTSKEEKLDVINLANQWNCGARRTIEDVDLVCQWSYQHKWSWKNMHGVAYTSERNNKSISQINKVPNRKQEQKILLMQNKNETTMHIT